MLRTTSLCSIVRNRCALPAASKRRALTAGVRIRSFCDASAAAGSVVTEVADKKIAKPAPAPPTPMTTWDTIVIGEIVDLHRHPEAERLNVCKVNIGDPDDLLQIICGAPNARQGARVPVAKIGTKLAIKEPTMGEVYVPENDTI
jgi:tRNA-binding EMAP/Myf-like protein